MAIVDASMDHYRTKFIITRKMYYYSLPAPLAREVAQARFNAGTPFDFVWVEL